MIVSKYEIYRDEIIQIAKENDFKIRTTANILSKKHDLNNGGFRKYVRKVITTQSQVGKELNERGISSEDFKHGWIKTKDGSYFVKNSNVLIAIQEVIDEFKSEIKPIEPTIYEPKQLNENLINQYTLTDFHLGMMAWDEESGDNWDLKIAEKTLLNFFKTSIELSPKAESCIFANIGDFLHWDGMDAVTPNNRNVLDADTRFTKLVRTSIRLIRQIVSMLLDKYKTVHLIMAEGNHDEASSIWLRELFSAFYELETRVTIDTNPDPYYCVKFGKVALFFHHGHLKRLNDLDSVLVAKFKKEFGESKFVYAHTGHMHNQQVRESNLMIIEQHRTLASRDAYASRSGWISGRDSKVITYHKDFGEVARNTISFEMIR